MRKKRTVQSSVLYNLRRFFIPIQVCVYCYHWWDSSVSASQNIQQTKRNLGTVESEVLFGADNHCFFKSSFFLVLFLLIFWISQIFLIKTMNLTSKTVHQILLVIIITFLSSHLSILASADQDASSSDQTDAGLFINDPYILSLNDQNLAANIFGQSEATVVMFYANWCGHCQHTAPVYSQLGSRIRPWRSAVKLVAINCANERYADVCREMGVIGYPTIVFSPSKTEEMADFVSLNEALNPVSAVPGAGDATDGLYSAILRQLNRARRGAVHPILVANKEEICGSFGFASPSTAPETTAYAIVENAPSVTSAEVKFLKFLFTFFNFQFIFR